MLLFEAIVCVSLFLLLCSAETSENTGFLCKDYVGSTTQKRNDSTENSNTRYIVIKLKNYDLSDLAHASKVCKQCYDAQVLSHLDVLNVPRTLLPVIVNVTAHVSRSSDGTKNVTWGNYSNLENFTNNDILWVYWHSNPSTFAMLAMSPSHDSNIRWAAIPQDGSYYNRRLHEASMYFFVVKNIVCQRPSRKSCHYWTTEGDRCVFHPKFGCHNFVDFMGQPPDDADNGTVCSKFKRMVKRCPLANCSCSVTPWSEWSLCDETHCTTSPSNRTRYRQVVEPCPIGWVHEILSQSEPCPLPENCQILANDFIMNDSVILRASTILRN